MRPTSRHKLSVCVFSLALGVLCLCSTPALSRTWQVTKAGNGDFLVIQDAVDAAADGDTVMIAAGRYDDFTWVQLGNFLQYVYCNKSLTFIGAGSTLTKIGKEDPDFMAPNVNQTGFGVDITNGVVRILGVGFENIRYGDSVWSANSNLEIDNCSFQHCSNGVTAFAEQLLIVRNCTFTDIGMWPDATDGGAVTILPPTNTAVIENSQFTDCFLGVNCNWPDTRDVSILNCSFTGEGRVGVSFITGASGVVRNCHLEGQDSWEILCSEAGNVVIEDNTITANYPSGGTAGVGNFFTGGAIMLRRNIITASGNNTCLDLNVSNLSFLARDNHFLRSDGPGLKCTAIGGPYGIDVRENWWGTTDPQEIADSIHDLLDDPTLQYQYLFEPFLDQPVATEKRSFGGLKMMFR